jgi:SH3 domain-containing protein
MMLVLVVPFVLPQDVHVGAYRSQEGSTLYVGTVNAGPLNVRDEPSTAGKVITQLSEGAPVVVTGVSLQSDLIAGHEGYWLRIKDYWDRDYALKQLGWVFSKYIDDVADLTPVPLVIGNVRKDAIGSLVGLTVGDNRGGVGHFTTVATARIEHQEFYTFTWNVERWGYHYANVPGTYVYYLDTDSIAHVSYHGHSVGDTRVYLTDDMMFQLETSGETGGVHDLVIRRVSEGQPVYAGQRCGPLNVVDHDVGVCEVHRVFGRTPDYTVEPEAARYIRDLFRTTPPEQWGDRGEVDVVIYYSLNMDTGNTVILSASFLSVP